MSVGAYQFLRRSLLNMQIQFSYLFRETWRIARRPLIVVMNVPIRKTDLTHAKRTWDSKAYLGHCSAWQTKKERNGVSKRPRTWGASDHALFKDLKERRFDVLVNTFDVNLPVDPSRKKIRNHPHAGTQSSSSLSTIPEAAWFFMLFIAALAAIGYLRLISSFSTRV